jgi:hypothetical protein
MARIENPSPNLPFAMLLRCCSAARQTGHSPQPQNLLKGELTSVDAPVNASYF